MKSDPDEKFIVRPDGRIISQEPILMLQYYSTSEEQRTLRVAGEQHPLYVVNRRAKLGGIWGHTFEVCSTNRGRDVASIDFHSIPPRIEIDLVRDNRKLKIKTNNTVCQHVVPGGLDRLYWQGTNTLACGRGSWKVRNTKGLVLLVTADDTRSGGVISLYSKGLDENVIEELVVIGIAQIEEYHRLSRAISRNVVMVL
ncbi:unnamed protein product [Fusarium equiseti]|uniref:Uncharacterized protein n=1 Tax=Fusarium equiseti TaxID=61235 RepID=A0A8J2ILM7_FUSEQ|nr:unnamed protein product [Fusarium equiseti]